MRVLARFRWVSWGTLVFAGAGWLAACEGGSADDDGADDDTAVPDDDLADDDSAPDDDASDDDSLPDDDSTPPPWPVLDGPCDPLVPEHCGFPFPSDVWLAPDPGTATGRRVAFAEGTLPSTVSGGTTDLAAFAFLDGFSTAAGPMTFLPGATGVGLADPDHVADTVLPDSKTVILDAATGQRVPHFAEVDVSTDDTTRRTLLLRPVVPLRHATRYVVAVRGVVDEAGALVPASPAFTALRDALASDDPSVERRRGLYDDLFARLDQAGFARGEVQIAWDFTTGTRESVTLRMLAMRDAALDEVGPDGPPYVIDSVQDDVDEHIARRIEGRVTVPLYLDEPGPGGTMTIGADGLPVRNGSAEYPFLILVPWSATAGPSPAIQFGHGLFGSRYNLDDTVYEEHLDGYGYVAFAMDWIGMSGEDVGWIANAIVLGDLHEFRTIPDRNQQGFLNKILMMRLLGTGLVSDPALQWEGRPLVDPDRRYYYGGSQGGIFGATLMSLHVDVTRGVLAVPGQAYSLMLPRSVLFDDFRFALDAALDDPRDIQLLLGYVQLLWDRSEPSGYSTALAGDTFSGTPDHQVVILESIGDHQVPNLASQLLARASEAVSLAPAVRDVYGVPVADAPIEAPAVLVEYDFGLPPVPIGNVPMREGDDPHAALAGVPAAFDLIDTFFRTGQVEQYCDGVCDPS